MDAEKVKMIALDILENYQFIAKRAEEEKTDSHLRDAESLLRSATTLIKATWEEAEAAEQEPKDKTTPTLLSLLDYICKIEGRVQKQGYKIDYLKEYIEKLK